MTTKMPNLDDRDHVSEAQCKRMAEITDGAFIEALKAARSDPAFRGLDQGPIDAGVTRFLLETLVEAIRHSVPDDSEAATMILTIVNERFQHEHACRVKRTPSH
jgi:hypothetical protein